MTTDSAPEDTPGYRELSTELRKLRGKTFGETPRSDIQRRFPLLASLAEQLGAYPVNGDPIRGLLLSATEQLRPDHLRRAALALFGLSPATYGKSVRARTEKARLAFTPVPSESTFRQQPPYLKLILDQLTQTLLNQLSSSSRPTSSRLNARLSARVGVRRPGTEARIRAALEGQSLPLTLWGEGGNGKTHLARHIAAEIRDELSADIAVAIIRRGSSARTDQPTYQSDLIECLRSVGQPVEDWSQAAQELELRNLLAGPRCFAALVLDDVDPDTITRLIPSECSSPVLVTSRRKPTADWPAIRVDAYEASEALEAVKAILSDLDDEKLAALCRTLGNRPVAIDISARMIKAGYTDLDGIMSALIDDTPGTLESAYELIGERVEASIVHLYHEVNAKVATKPAAAAIVDTLLWATSGNVEDYVIEGLLAKLVQTEAQRISHRAAFAWLVNIGLIHIDRSTIEINGLSRTLLRWIRYHTVAGVARSVFDTLLGADNPFRSDPVEPWYISLEQANEKAAGFLQAVGATLRVSNNMFERLLGAGSWSLLSAGIREWLIKEEDLGLFFEDRRGEEYGIVEVRDEALVFWSPFGPPRRVSWRQGWFLSNAISLALASVDSDMKHVLSDGSQPLSALPNGRFEWFPWFEMRHSCNHERYRHSRMDPLRSTIVLEDGCLSRSLCGQLFMADSTHLSLRECPDCAIILGSREILTALEKLVAHVLVVIDASALPRELRKAYWLAVKGRLIHLNCNIYDRAQPPDDYGRAVVSYLDAFARLTDMLDESSSWLAEFAYGILEHLINVTQTVVGLRSVPICRWLLTSPINLGSNSQQIIYRCSVILASHGYLDEALSGLERCAELMRGDDAADRGPQAEKILKMTDAVSRMLSKSRLFETTSLPEIRMRVSGVRVESYEGVKPFIDLKAVDGPGTVRAMVSPSVALVTAAALDLGPGSHSLSADIYMLPFALSVELLHRVGVAIDSVEIGSCSVGDLIAKLSFSNGSTLVEDPLLALVISAWTGTSLLVGPDLIDYSDKVVNDEKCMASRFGGDPYTGPFLPRPRMDTKNFPLNDMLSMNIVGAQVDEAADEGVIVLSDRKGRRLPVSVGAEEAVNIASWQPRSASTVSSDAHGFLCRLLTAAGLHLISVTIAPAGDNVITSQLSFSNGIRIWSRPGDAMAFAQRTGADIRVAEGYLESRVGIQANLY